MSASAHLLPFSVDDLVLGLELCWLRRVLPAVAYTPLPGAPGIILGIVDIAGQMVPVASLRERLGLAYRPQRRSEHLLWVDTGRWQLLLPVDGVGVARAYAPEAVLPASELPLPVARLKGVLRTAEGLLLIQELPAFLSLDEEQALAGALQAHAD
ncbi:MAG: chemotaxis protein CheW [Gammaproteobacteria bacterium]|nr:chemotaxis protein CheW [Gammaproteobacteria bacterium]